MEQAFKLFLALLLDLSEWLLNREPSLLGVLGGPPLLARLLLLIILGDKCRPRRILPRLRVREGLLALTLSLLGRPRLQLEAAATAITQVVLS